MKNELLQELYKYYSFIFELVAVQCWVFFFAFGGNFTQNVNEKWIVVTVKLYKIWWECN